MSCSVTCHRTHENADKDCKITGFAAFNKNEELKPFTYNPPKLGEEGVEIQISHSAICGSDIHTIDSDWQGANYPVIVGHEIIGKVVAIGSSVSKFSVGDRVGVGPQCFACMNKDNNCEECEQGLVQHCRNSMLWTYDAKYPDGQLTHGGYADRIRVNHNFVFKVPESIKSEYAAPLMCAGLTTFSPLNKVMTRPGMKIGIIGIGGIGHLAVMWASKLQDGKCEVTAISHNDKRRDDSLRLGAHKFLDTSDEKAVKAAKRTFDFILGTADAGQKDMENWLSMLKVGGSLCQVGLPSEPFPINPFVLLESAVKFTSSCIGSIKDMEEMLQFAAKHDVQPWIETMPMEKVNEAIKKFRNKEVHFRIVLVNSNVNV